MRPTSQAWQDNRLEDIAVPSVLTGRLETYKPTITEPEVTTWPIDSHATAQNAVDASVEQGFDYSRTHIPFDASTIRIENGVFGGEPDPTYDFSDPLVGDNLRYAGTLECTFGYHFDDNSFETVDISRHVFSGAEISDDDLYVTLKGEAFASALDEDTFYGGRYAVGGIPASTLFTEILEDVNFADRGWWNYILGDENCKVSASQPLWSDSGFVYYHVDPYFDNIDVLIPIPPMSHREALTTVAAYVGAYVFGSRDGSIYIQPELPVMPVEEEV